MTEATRLHGGPDALGVPLHDFSTNSNACGPCPQALAAVQAADATRYPDPAYTVLRGQLAVFHGVDPARVLLAGSASEFIFRITAWVASQGLHTVRVPVHGYSDYAEAARAWGLCIVTSGACDLQWHADPSSPLGETCELDSWQATSCVQVVDLAYEPLRLSGRSSFAPIQPTGQIEHVSPNEVTPSASSLWQLWTPNKALGLTGVRGAYAIAPPGVEVEAVSQLERLCASWPVGAHGVALLQAWTQASTQAWLADSRCRLAVWKSRQIDMLESMGWVCVPSHANFLCARTGSNDLDGDLLRLRHCGLKLRNAASFGLPGHVRLGVLPPQAQDALRAAWQKSMRRDLTQRAATAPQIKELT